jgi:hypothetical protein
MNAEVDTLSLAAIALFAAHHVGDYLLQSDHQAVTKGECSHAGRMACTRHVAVLTAAQGVALALVLGATGTAVSPWALLIGLAVNAGSHWWADRRATLRGLVLATEPLTAKVGFYDRAPGGAAHMDQAWHIGWMLPAAVAIAAPLPLALAVGAGSAVLLLIADVVSRRARAAEAARAH